MMMSLQTLWSPAVSVWRRIWTRGHASSLGERLAHGAFWSLFGTAASRLLGLVASMIVARVLGKAAFGELGIVQSTIGMFGTFAGFGLGMTATKHVAEFRTTDPERAGRVVRMSSLLCWLTGGLAAVALACSARWLADRSLACPHLSGELRVSALYLLLSTVNGGQMGALSGFEAFRKIALVNWLLGGLTVVLLPAGGWFGGLMGSVWGLIVAQGIVCGFSWRAIVRTARDAGVPLRLAGWTAEIPMLWRFSVPTTLTNLLGMPVAWVCQALLARQPGGATHVAEYYSAMQLRNMPLTMVGVLASAVLPVYANARATGGLAAQRRIRSLTQGAMLVAIFPILLAMAVFSGPLLMAYGKEFLPGAGVLRLLLMAVAFEALANVQMQIMVGNGQVWPVFLCYGIGCAAYVGLAFGLIPSQFGAGLGWATVGWQAARWVSSSAYLFYHDSAGRLKAGAAPSR